MPGAALRLTAPAAGLVRARPPPSSSLARWDARSCRCSGRTLAESPARLLSETLPFFLGRQPPLFSAFSSPLSCGPPLGQRGSRPGGGRGRKRQGPGPGPVTAAPLRWTP